MGTWIERNVPAGSEIAVLGQKPVFWRTPPFAFENYPLTIFYQTDTGFIREMNPAWIVDQIRYRLTVEEKQNTPEAIPPDRYEIAHRFDPPKILGFIPAVTPGYEFPCQSIVIWKRAE